MPNITEQDSFDAGVYQYQTSDQALGGPGGVMNTPLGNLANRTRFLLNRIIDGALKYVNDSGAVNTITLTLPQPFPDGLIDGMEVGGRVAVSNNGAVTLTLPNTGGPTLPTLPLYGGDNTNMVGGELPAGAIFKAKLNLSLNAANGGAWVLQWVTGGYNRISTPPVGDTTAKIANMYSVYAATDGLTTVNMAPAGNVVLTSTQYGYAMLNLTGAPGAAKSLIFPTGQTGQWVIENDTTGGYPITAQTLGNAGAVLPVGVPVVVRSDGTTVKLVTAGLSKTLTPDGNGNVLLDQSPPQFDASLKLVTSAFLKAAGIQYSGVNILAASRSIAASDIGALLLNNANNTLTVVAPNTIGVPGGDGFTITNYGSNTLALAFSGCTYEYGAAALSSNLSVLAGESLTLIAAATGTSWYVVSSNAGLGNTGSFAASLSSSGYQKLPGGLIVQWGPGIISTADTVNTFPLAFPNSCLSLAASSGYTAGSGQLGYIAASPTSKSQFTARASNSNLGWTWIAVGY
jgi:hypothetical protein